MKFTLDANLLSHAMSKLDKFPRTVSSEAGQSVEFKIETGVLTLSVFNETASVTCHLLGSDLNETGSFCVDFKVLNKLVGGLYAEIPAVFTVTATDVTVRQGSAKLKVPVMQSRGRIRFTPPENGQAVELGLEFVKALSFVTVAAPSRIVGRGRYAGAVVSKDCIVAEHNVMRSEALLPVDMPRSIGIPTCVLDFLTSSKFTSLRLVWSDQDPNTGVKSFLIEPYGDDKINWAVCVLLRHPDLSPTVHPGPVVRVQVTRDALVQMMGTVSSVLGDAESALHLSAVGTTDSGEQAVCFSGKDNIAFSESELWIPCKIQGTFRPVKILRGPLQSLVKSGIGADVVDLLIPEDVKLPVVFQMSGGEGVKLSARIMTVN